MLRELRVENVGVIAEVGLVFGSGMTVITGETGAGKTLLVEAIELLLGARADATLVRQGADAARVEARFEVRGPELAGLQEIAGLDDLIEGEIVVARVVPTEGRSRAYLNGRLVPAAALSAVGALLVDLHGQHAHHALLSPPTQRHALDEAGAPATTDALGQYRSVRREVAGLLEALSDLGGDVRARAREIDLLRFQVDEIERAGLSDPDEESALEAEESMLASAEAHRRAAAAARSALEGGGADAIAEALAAIGDASPLADIADRARLAQEELAELARELRQRAETIDDDPERLAAVSDRRRLLRDLRKKYGEDLTEVMAFADAARDRLAALGAAEERAEELEQALASARSRAIEAAKALSAARRAAAPSLGEAITAELRELAMPHADFMVEVGPGVAPEDDLPERGIDEVRFLLAANPGEGHQPLARAASGGELARTMLAARVVLTAAPPTLVFDEVDAGIGGEAGVAVGRRLAAVARSHQVLCVTHLAQVAAFADTQVVVAKEERRGRTEALAQTVEGTERVNELSRMLSGTETDRARRHAEELLAVAAGSSPATQAASE